MTEEARLICDRDGTRLVGINYTVVYNVNPYHYHIIIPV